ncbi:hypothetical protein O6H91_10G031000 [Diphasiastrum complanatum]|uniref:Uncharacterized protein n=1 Tax=Diphasiastrum complanatum TaxID=34168 RepID=A0ACC2CFP7_DIPCM|nr:hypothetical protein O6H91_10G031000 [Diphasiastrum complanatum]
MLIPTTTISSVTTCCPSFQTSQERLSLETAEESMEPKLKEIVEGDNSPSSLGGRSDLAWRCSQFEIPISSSSMDNWNGVGTSMAFSPSELQVSSLQRHRKGGRLVPGAGAGPECIMSDDESLLDVGQVGSSPLDVQLKIPERAADGHSLSNLNDEEVPLDHISALSEEPPSTRVKLMCSFGGKILPRPSDGRLRYVGGETRIVAVHRDIRYQELMLKMTELYGVALTLKYQLPGEDLDALVSVSSDEDLENMMEEYDRLEAGDGMSRLRIFLFSAAEHEIAHVGDSLGDFKNSERRYVDAVNGVVETSREHSDIGIQGGAVLGVEDLIGLDSADTSRYLRVEDSLPVPMMVAQVSHEVIKQLQVPVSLPFTSLQSVSNPSSAPPSAPSSPSFLPRPSQMKQPSVLDLSSQYLHDQVTKVNVHPYANFSADLKYQEVEFSSSPPLPGANVPEFHYESRRTADSFVPVQRELHPSGFHHDNSFRGDQQHVGDNLISRVGSQGKFVRAQEHHLELPLNMRVENRSDMQQLPDISSQKEYQRLVLQQPQQLPLPQHAQGNHADSHFRAEQRRFSDSLMPRVNSYGKLSRLQEQYVDPRPSSVLTDNRPETHHFQEVLSAQIEQQKLFHQQQAQLQQQSGLLQEKAVREQRHLSESLMPRVGSHGKLAHMQDQHLDNSSPTMLADNRPDGQQVPEKLQQIDLQRLVLQSQQQQQQLQQPPGIYQENTIRTEQRQLGESVLPRVGSHGKLTRLQEQHLDPQPSIGLAESRRTSQQMPEMLPQSELQRAAIQHQLLPWPHTIDAQHDNHRRPERLPLSYSDHGHSHQQAVQQHSLIHQLHYHSIQALMHDALNRQAEQPHHQDDSFSSHYQVANQDALNRQVEQPHHQDDAFSGHLIHRSVSSQAVSSHASHVMPSASAYHAGSDPSSPRLNYRETPQRQAAPILHAHRPYNGPLLVDQQYGRRPHVYDPLNRAFRLSKSPPRYRDVDDHAMWQHPQQVMGNLESSKQDQAPNIQLPYDGASAQYSEVLARSGVSHYVGPFEEGPAAFQDNCDAMEMKRQMAHGKDPAKVLLSGQQYYHFSPMNSRREYQDQLSPNLEQVSIHGRYHERQETGQDRSSLHRVCERDDSRLNLIERAWKGQTEYRESELRFDLGVNGQRDLQEVRYSPCVPEDSGNTYAFEDPYLTLQKRSDSNEILLGSAFQLNTAMQQHVDMSMHSVGIGRSFAMNSSQTAPLYAEISNQTEHISPPTVVRTGESLQDFKIVASSSEQNYGEHMLSITGPLPASFTRLSNGSSEPVYVDQLISKSSCLPSTMETSKNVMLLEANQEVPPSGGTIDSMKVEVTEQSQHFLRDSGGTGFRVKDDLGKLSSNKNSDVLHVQGKTSGTVPALQELPVSPVENPILLDGNMSSSPSLIQSTNEDEPLPGTAFQLKSISANSLVATSTTPIAKSSQSGSLMCSLGHSSMTLDTEGAPLSNNQHRDSQLASTKSILPPVDVAGAAIDLGHIFPPGISGRSLSAIQMSATRDLAENMASSILGSQEISCKDVTEGLVETEICGEEEALSAGGQKPVIRPSLPKQEQGNAQTPVDADVFPIEEPDGHLAQVREGTAEHNLITKEIFAQAVERRPGDVNNKDEVKKSRGDAASAEAEAIARGLQTIRNADLEEIRELGSGTFGTVYYGKWRGSDVAIKRIKASCFAGRPAERERLIADFWKEACTLSQLHHPNVVAFYGVVPDGPGGTLATVTEYMVNGSLKQVLQKKDRTIDRRKRLLIAMDAAFGMEYLHGKNIVHFDLKCENLLVNMRDPHRPICKVGDLGLSKVKHQTMVSGGVRGTLPWMAPELLNGNSSLVTEKVDIFSFGIVMWELLTGEEPYANMHYGAIIGIVNNTLRPPIPNWCDPGWRSLMERCWAPDHANRPSFSEIANELRAMTASVQTKS